MHQNQHKYTRTNNRTEQVVTLIRLHLYNSGEFCGARAIQRHMQELQEPTIPSLSTIQRILVRQCLTHGRTGFYPGEEDVDFNS
jgi:ATP adenylyltransferase/5',5'''-P-1,P-4-tetraphosphate phosphorylase II